MTFRIRDEKTGGNQTDCIIKTDFQYHHFFIHRRIPKTRLIMPNDNYADIKRSRGIVTINGVPEW